MLDLIILFVETDFQNIALERRGATPFFFPEKNPHQLYSLIETTESLHLVKALRHAISLPIDR